MDSGPSPTTTTIEDVISPVALNLDMKPQMELRQSHHHQQHQTQKMRKCALRIKENHLQQQTYHHNHSHSHSHSKHNNNNIRSSPSRVVEFENSVADCSRKLEQITNGKSSRSAAAISATRSPLVSASVKATTTTAALPTPITPRVAISSTNMRKPKRKYKANASNSAISTTNFAANTTTTALNTATSSPSITTTTKEKFLFTLDLLAVVRRNASDKLKLIQMVHDNPILWDSRLPNFKGAEEEKTRAWEHIGKEFNAPGRRVARAFKSLRESYRRELAHVKVMGSGFKPKWSLYEAMDFLRDVIRERKGGSHMIDHSATAGLNLRAFSPHRASLTHNSHNNNNSNHSNSNLSNGNNHLSALAHSTLSSSLNESALNLSSRSSLSLNQDGGYNYFVKRELDLSSTAGHSALQPTAAHQNISTLHHDARVSSTRNDNIHNNNNGTNNIHNGNAINSNHITSNNVNASNINSTNNVNNNGNMNNNNNHNFEDMDGGSSSPRSGDEAASMRNPELSCSDGVEELEAIDADFPYPLILDNSVSPSGGGLIVSGGKRRRKDVDMMNGGGTMDEEVDDGDDEGDAYGGQMLQQHRHLRSQNGLDMPLPQTVREVLNSKFCGFISAKLNSMEDTEADNLMNKILMLLVQTQGNALLQETGNK